VRLILDTSIVISATRSFIGASRLLVNMAFLRRFELLLSVPLSFEYESVLKRAAQVEASGLTLEDAEELLASLMYVGLPVELGEYLGPRSIDPDDNHILSLAFFGAADAIVTFNTRHFARPARLMGVNLSKPAQALAVLGR
jgi:predicted nucleic acid-binding protein